MPCPKTHPKEFENWLNRRKLEHWHKTHKEVIEWGDKLIAPPELFGAWVEVEYIQYEGTVFDFKTDAKPETVNDITLKLGDIFLLLWKKWEWSCPFVIQIDNTGKCHLRHYMDRYGNVKTIDKILRNGTSRMVKYKYESMI